MSLTTIWNLNPRSHRRLVCKAAQLCAFVTAFKFELYSRGRQRQRPNGKLLPNLQDYLAIYDRARQRGAHRPTSSGFCGSPLLRHPLIKLPRDVRHDSQLTLDQHQLPPMVHLMLLRA